MNRPSIRNVNREAAEAFAPGPGVACLSITQPGHPASLSRKFVSLLRLEFYDWDLDRYSMEAAGGNPANVSFFAEEQAAQIAAYLRLVVEMGWHLVVHCDAGVSRSGAVVDAALRAFPEHFEDKGWPRHGNNYVRRLILRALGAQPVALLQANGDPT